MAQNVLTEEDLQRIKSGLDSSRQASELIDLAKQAGLDVSALEQRNKETEQQLLRFKNVFFPGQ